jgi:hypothetical protein
LSAKDRNEYRAAGRCFNCGETGHMSRNCPSATSMPSNRLNRPPGLSAHNVEVEIDDYEHVSGLDEVTETIDEIPVASMRIAFPSSRLHSNHRLGDVHRSRRTRIDDFVAERAMYILEQMRPYPNDGHYLKRKNVVLWCINLNLICM